VAHAGVKKVTVAGTLIGPFLGHTAQRQNNELIFDERNQSFDAIYTVHLFTPVASVIAYFLAGHSRRGESPPERKQSLSLRAATELEFVEQTCRKHASIEPSSKDDIEAVRFFAFPSFRSNVDRHSVAVIRVFSPC
jgi:hypothetical protein